MTKKWGVVITLLVVFGRAATAQLTIDWAYGADLRNAGKGTFLAGWQVQMYRDVNRDSNLSLAQEFHPTTGAVLGHPSLEDDVMLGAWTTSLVSGKAGVNWGIFGASGDALSGFHCYTVIWNAPSLASASLGIIVDSTPWQFPSSGYSSYIRSSVAGNWLPVPEPTTFALMGIGAALLGIRKIVKKA